MVRRKRWTWRPFRPGLAPELTAYRGLTCPWLSRTAGVPVCRPDALQAGFRRTAELILTIKASIEPFEGAIRKAADALNAFGAAYAAAVKVTK